MLLGTEGTAVLNTLYRLFARRNRWEWKYETVCRDEIRKSVRHEFSMWNFLNLESEKSQKNMYNGTYSTSTTEFDIGSSFYAHIQICTIWSCYHEEASVVQDPLSQNLELYQLQIHNNQLLKSETKQLWRFGTNSFTPQKPV